MTLVSDAHTDHGAAFVDRGGREVVDHYGRPDSVGRAVRNGVGTIEMGYGIVVVTGEDRVEFVDDAVSNTVPRANGEGVYALLLDPQGGIETDMYVYNAGERLLVFTPPNRAEPLVEQWRENVFIQDVEIRDASAEFGVFGVHGPTATEKIASVLNGAGSPEPALSFVRGTMVDAGVTVIATDAPLGEEGYEVVCAAADASEVFDTLLVRGLNSAPFGYRTWDALTLEAGTPLFEYELDGRIPNVAGIRNALDFEKGCYVGQEVVSRVENQGRPSRRLVGLALESGSALDEGSEPASLPEAGAAIVDGDAAIGEITRAVESPTLDVPIAFGYVEYGAVESGDTVAVRVHEADVPARRVDLPVHEGSAGSARLPRYSD
ncbi:aminomethyltransferase [Halopenitus malekzadehii]|uniref:Aminomethyltransferase n=1 Tax=Halopenitus malekzadehii TaxID=1267564 RepID=A0A1H6JHX9_9EURY|nr:aminomethyltransferase family protein [Halopenitus malekzadehii]SEH59349.1 aminomethyltransferase [Halopenitus malekzadehii]